MSTADERPLAGAVPLWEVPGWRERFGVVAGITGRGADPAAPFDLGFRSDQPVGAVMRRWRAFRAALPAFPGSVLAHQVHATEVLWHSGAPAGFATFDGADGHATDQPGRLLLVTAADCIPIYLVAPVSGVVALLHSGWRGTAGGILARGLDRLRSAARVEPRDVVMHLGVGICGTCYEVGREVVESLGFEANGAGPWHVDLRAELAQQAERLGVGEITSSGHCSSCEAGSFFSHRRSRGADGRMIAYLGRAV